MQLTEQQLRFMDTFGFLHFPGLLADRIDGIVDAFEEVWERHGGGHEGKPHDGTARSCIVPFAGQSAELSSLLDDARIDGILSSLLGDDYVYLGSDGNYYVGDTGWHSDGGWPRPIVYYKIGFYLDELTRDTGAIRVIPGSHRYGEGYAEALQAGVREPEGTWGVGGDRRRMFTLNCTRRHTDEELPIMRQEVANFARFQTDSVYGDAMVDTATPVRMWHLEQPLANQDHLAALSEKARQERGEPSRG